MTEVRYQYSEFPDLMTNHRFGPIYYLQQNFDMRPGEKMSDVPRSAVSRGWLSRPHMFLWRCAGVWRYPSMITTSALCARSLLPIAN